jgi:hypothetical protein
MRKKKKGKKAETASSKAIMASVTKEMAQPRVAESAQVAADGRSKKRRGKPPSRRAGRTAKTRIEQYGSGTPTVERKT